MRPGAVSHSRTVGPIEVSSRLRYSNGAFPNLQLASALRYRLALGHRRPPKVRGSAGQCAVQLQQEATPSGLRREARIERNRYRRSRLQD